MPITKMTSRELHQHTAKAKRAAQDGPVLITDRGRPSHVLLTIEGYEQTAKQKPTIHDLLAHPEAAEIEFEPPRRMTGFPRANILEMLANPEADAIEVEFPRLGSEFPRAADF